jgi:hypothetical protein
MTDAAPKSCDVLNTFMGADPTTAEQATCSVQPMNVDAILLVMQCARQPG